MRTLNLLRTQAFRIALVYLALFAVSAVALVGFTYWNTARVLDDQTDQTIAAEIQGLQEQYQRLGLRGLREVIINRSIRGGQGLYLLTDRERNPLAGNLDGWPQVEPGGGSFVEFDYERRLGSESEKRQARGRAFALTGGFLLLVARDVHERRELERLFTTTLPWSVALMVTLGLAGGLLISRNVLARLDTINRTSREIVAGDLTRRVPVTGAGDEFDDLAGHLNRMLERIERLMHGMREVTDSIAHDLRTPLNRLRNRLEIMLRRLPQESTEARALESAVGETDNLIATFNALLLIAEAEAGVVRESMVPVALKEAVEGVAELYGPLAEQKGIALVLDCEGDAVVRGNKNLLSQAVANLVDNGIKYSEAGGEVRVGVRQLPGAVEISVADRGCGIPPADRERVLERFVRLEASRNSPGTGLGLSLVAAVARLHDATFGLFDNEPGLRAIIRFAAGAPANRIGRDA